MSNDVTDREFQLVLEGINRVENSLRDHVKGVEIQRERVNLEFAAIRLELQKIQLWKARMVGMGTAAGGVTAALVEAIRSFMGR